MTKPSIVETSFPGLTMTATHIPSEVQKDVSKSQVKWKIVLQYGSQKYETEYSTGIGHLKRHKQGMDFRTVDERQSLSTCLHNGRSGMFSVVPPSMDDVIQCLLSDAEAIDFATFEEWAGNFGFDTDSREGERAYNACLKTGLALRQMFGESGLQKLNRVVQGIDESGELIGRIDNSGMGGFLNPPTHPEYDYCVRYGTDGSMSLSAGAESDELDEATRMEAKKLLSDWVPPPMDDPEVVKWVHQVLGYFKGCWRNPNVPEPECWHADKLLANRLETWTIDPIANITLTLLDNVDDHAGVHLIRKWYPEFMPTEEDFVQAKWGS